MVFDWDFFKQNQVHNHGNKYTPVKLVTLFLFSLSFLEVVTHNSIRCLLSKTQKLYSVSFFFFPSQFGYCFQVFRLQTPFLSLFWFLQADWTIVNFHSCFLKSSYVSSRLAHYVWCRRALGSTVVMNCVSHLQMA